MFKRFQIAIACLALFTTHAVAEQPPTRPTSRPGGEIVAPPRRETAGRHVDLSCGRLFVPAYLGDRDRVDLVLWFRGAAWCVEQNFDDAKANAVLFTWDEKKRPLGFKDQKSADDLLAEIQTALGDSTIDHLLLGSFSGGYPAILDLLKLEPIRARVTDVILADSLYPPRGTTDAAKIDAVLGPIADFATWATKGECTFLYTQLYPPEPQYRGNSSTVAAMWLIDRIGGKRIDCDEMIDGRRALYHVDEGNLHITGFAGMLNQDHFDHLYHAAWLFKQTSIAK